MTCSCSHRALTHRYVTATRSNVGECLARECGCVGFVGAESAQDPHFVRDSGVSAWENGGTNTDGPRRCANTVIQGPRRSNKEID